MPICQSCGTDNSNDMNFCGKCGIGLTGATGQLSPETIMEGRYIIVKVIGRGGMGAVYLALDQRLDNMPVAIKEMSTTATGTGNLERAVEAFKMEAKMLIKLEHQALPRIRDFFRIEDRWYLVMDYIEGETLKEIVERRGPISDTQILDWAKQLCEILDYLHSQQPPVIFRDLKPSNIMLTNKGVIKLIDFGIARHFKPGQSADTIAFGSTGFAPPEQYGNTQTDARTDIFALGATLHYLVTGIDPGSRPFNFEPPSKRVNISPSLEYAIMKAVEMQVERRFESTKEMMDALIAGKEEAAAKFDKVSAKQEEVNNVEDCSSQAIEHSVKENKKEVAEEPQNISPEVKQNVTVGLLDFSEDDLIDIGDNENISKLNLEKYENYEDVDELGHISIEMKPDETFGLTNFKFEGSQTNKYQPNYQYKVATNTTHTLKNKKSFNIKILISLLTLLVGIILGTVYLNSSLNLIKNDKSEIKNIVNDYFLLANKGEINSGRKLFNPSYIQLVERETGIKFDGGLFRDKSKLLNIENISVTRDYGDATVKSKKSDGTITINHIHFSKINNLWKIDRDMSEEIFDTNRVDTKNPEILLKKIYELAIKENYEEIPYYIYPISDGYRNSRDNIMYLMRTKRDAGLITYSDNALKKVIDKYIKNIKIPNDNELEYIKEWEIKEFNPKSNLLNLRNESFAIISLNNNYIITLVKINSNYYLLNWNLGTKLT